MSYMTGFGNEFATEAVAGALPQGRNSPQKPAFGLYAEQVSGTPFTAPRHVNRRTWMYRIRPSVVHEPYVRIDNGLFLSTPFTAVETTPNQLRWDPLPIPETPTTFLQGMRTMAGNGDLTVHSGVAIHHYVCNVSMDDTFFYNADGEMLIVAEHGQLRFLTECGIIDLSPGEICVIPRGIKFRVETSGPARGYVLENYGAPLRLPDLGPIGANGLAYPRDFLTPVAWYEERTGRFSVVAKFQGNLWRGIYDHSPLNVVAWHGNYAPYKYDLANFQCINTVTFDHPDPSIYTVLTSPSEIPGTANMDFVIFPPRWMVAENTFRPPWFHRNFMNEYMGLIKGVYDAKEGGGFVPGGASLHNCMSGHGPDADTYTRMTTAELSPVKLENTLAFMFETRFVCKPTAFAMSSGELQRDYWECWQGLQPEFRAP
ncbi:MAG TPA: homogentisate 1,2-dioxygenase [Bacteroidetes bacterium]|nr:homogentisate 1,2-dioxygenase [Bacteroidota bacterium]HRK03548.1 homogentisate 1,2-dioxygenase [Chlorobiota bacterium]